MARLGHDPLSGRIKAVSVTTGTGDCTRDHNRATAFADLVLLGVTRDFFGLFDP